MTDEDGKAMAHLRWLRDELPTLVERQVLDAAGAARLREHYGLGELREPRSVALLIFGALGALLVGLGLILVVAHNWDTLSRATRAALSLLLLLAAQGLGAFTLLRRRDSGAFCEASGLLLTLCTGASIALIGQTYHVTAVLGDFMLTWLALVVPAVYLLRSRLSAVLCLGLALFLPEMREGLGDRGFSYLAVVAALVPYLWHVSRALPDQGRTLLLQWAGALSIPVGLMMLLFGGAAGDAEELALPFLSALAAAMYALGRAREGHGEARLPGFRAPLSTTGLVGAVTLAIVMTFDDPWPWESRVSMLADLREPEVQLALLATLALAALPLRRALAALGARDWGEALLLGVPVLALLGAVLLALTGDELSMMVVGNVYALALGIGVMQGGLARASLRQTNVGLATLAVLITVRFLDSELSMATRGIAMMLVGVAFVAVNVWLLRRGRGRGGHGDQDEPQQQEVSP